MKACLVNTLALCLAGSGLAAPTDADSSRPMPGKVVAAQRESSNMVQGTAEADVEMGSSESGDLVGSLRDALRYGDDEDEDDGLLGGFIIPGLLKRDDEDEDDGLLGGSIIPGLLKRDLTAGQLRNLILERLAAEQQGAGDAHDKRDAQKISVEQLGRKLLERILSLLRGGDGDLLKRDGQEMTVDQLRTMIMHRLDAAAHESRAHHDKRTSDAALKKKPGQIENIGENVGSELGEGTGGILDSLLNFLNILGPGFLDVSKLLGDLFAGNPKARAKFIQELGLEATEFVQGGNQADVGMTGQAKNGTALAAARLRTRLS